MRSTRHGWQTQHCAIVPVVAAAEHEPVLEVTLHGVAPRTFATTLVQIDAQPGAPVDALLMHTALVATAGPAGPCAPVAPVAPVSP